MNLLVFCDDNICFQWVDKCYKDLHTISDTLQSGIKKVVSSIFDSKHTF